MNDNGFGSFRITKVNLIVLGVTAANFFVLGLSLGALL